MAASAKLRLGRVNDTYVIRMEGYGSLWESHALATAISACVAEGATQFAIDLSPCVYLDSTFLGNLVVLDRRFTSQDGVTLTIVADAETCEQLFGATHLDRVLHITPELDTTDIHEWVTIERGSPDSIQIGRHSAQCHRELGELGGPDADKFLRIAERLEREIQSANS